MRSSIQIGEKAPGFSLIGSDGMIHTLIDYKGYKGVCFFFISLKCDSSREILEDIRLLKENYKKKSIAFVGICKKDISDSFGECLKHLKELDMDMDMLLDATGDLLKKFGVMVTPHFFIFNQSKHLIYDGLCKDDKINYLSQTLDQLVGGAPISVPKTDPIGSSINEYVSV